MTAEEAEALAQPAEGAPRDRVVAARDFREPLRLARTEIDRIARSAARAITEIEGSLRVWLRGAWKVRIESVSEINARQLLESVRDPYFLLAFDCAGRSCWAMWDPAFASAAAEIALGTVAIAEPKARDLSTVERGVLRNMLGRALASIAHTLDVQVKDVRAVHGNVELELERADARATDPTRLAIHVALSGPLGDSTLRLYLAGVVPPAGAAAPKEMPQPKDKKRPAAPEHLVEVPFVLSAQLGAAEIALSDLLGIEPGDVIPLPASIGSPLAVYVDGVPCASARFGEHKGKLAIQLIDFRAPGAEPQT
ncbi:MAG: FliM/FliN family flagellar motor switch protein [Planctomycetes bacterium]|nr:FliM/FliN family flagellar motor switch protein [Planctomycetota bacterium]